MTDDQSTLEKALNHLSAQDAMLIDNLSGDLQECRNLLATVISYLKWSDFDSEDRLALQHIIQNTLDKTINPQGD